MAEFTQAPGVRKYGVASRSSKYLHGGTAWVTALRLLVCARQQTVVLVQSSIRGRAGRAA